MNAFVNAMKTEGNYTHTANGAVAYASTNSSIVDLFGTIGALRNRSERDIEQAFEKAFAEDALLATKMTFYARNVRGGLGERRTAKVMWAYLANSHPDIVRKNIQYIPAFGRWDDLYALVGTPVEPEMWGLIKAQYEADMEVYDLSQKDEVYRSISLMAKWLKTIKTNNQENRKLAMRTARVLRMSDKEYRLMLSKLRKYLQVAETLMTNNQWQDINYEGVTSGAMKRYRTAFHKHDGERFVAYKEALSKGEAKVNAATLYPYDLLEAYHLTTSGYRFGSRNEKLAVSVLDPVLEAQWKALPNYVEGENNILVMADTSGSMEGRPLASAVGLGIYFAERNRGAFKDVLMTFSSRPSFVTLKGDTLKAKIQCVPSIVENTNLLAAFELILQTAVSNKVPAADMPKSLVIISDMQFDSASNYSRDKREQLHMVQIAQKFATAGYPMPNIVYWNVNASNDTFHVLAEDQNVQLLSGQSVAAFKTVIASIGRTAYEAVAETLNSETYAMITI